MATKKSEEKEIISSKISAENIETITKQIWLAGLGAYGRTIDELQSRGEKISSDSQKMFAELVERGEKLQDLMEDKLQDSKGKLKGKIKDSKDSLEKRIEKLKSFPSLPFGSNLEEQLTEVNRKLDALKSEIKKKTSA